jgi:DNA-binding MarR family transcriptional regulator
MAASSKSQKKKRGAVALSQREYESLAEFRYALRQFLAFSKNAAARVGLAPQQHQALLVIKGFRGDSPPTIGDLAKRMAVRHHSAVGLVDRLVAAGLAVRVSDTEDKRRVSLKLTRKAESALAQLSAANHSELKRLSPLIRPLLAQVESD